MDVNVNLKRTRNRKRKRHLKVKRREQARLEVRFAKRRKLVPEQRNNATILRSKDKSLNTMQANTFWENYEAAYEWQRRHSVEWWKSRCIALEQENAILKDKIRELASSPIKRRVDNSREKPQSRGSESQSTKYTSRDFEGLDKEDENSDNNDNLEFQVDEEMMKFFEHSIRHKMELKEKREVESAIEEAEAERVKRNIPIEGGAAWMQGKTENAQLLYGISSPRILAMETALQATIDRHKDRTKPQYWPNIPLNL